MIDVCYTCNETYAPIVGTSIISILRNVSAGVHFSILCDTFSQETKEKFAQIEKNYSCKIDCIDISEKMETLMHTVLAEEPGIIRNGKISYMYARLFMGSALAEDIDKVIYIDADTIVQGDVAELFAIPLKEDRLVAAIRDVWPVNYHKVIGFATDDLYFQSGLMLVNLRLWREKKIEERIMSYIAQLKHYPALHDQDIINICLQGKIQTLPVKYGLIYLLRRYSPADIYVFSGKTAETYYSAYEIESAQITREVIHYSGDYFGRPWIRPYACEDAKIWQSYFDKSPWCGNNPYEQGRDVKYLIKKLLFPFVGRIWLNRFRDRCWRNNESLYQQNQ